jgi:hypothetical protein
MVKNQLSVVIWAKNWGMVYGFVLPTELGKVMSFNDQQGQQVRDLQCFIDP